MSFVIARIQSGALVTQALVRQNRSYEVMMGRVADSSKVWTHGESCNWLEDRLARTDGKQLMTLHRSTNQYVTLKSSTQKL